MTVATLGAYLRLQIDHNFKFVWLGQFLLGVAANFIINTNMQFCYNWFSQASRPIFLSLVAIMNIFGGGIGNLLPLIFVSDDETNAVIVQAGLHRYNMYAFVIIAVLCVLTFALFRDKPPAGYGYIGEQVTAETDKATSDTNFLQESYFYLKYALSFGLFRTYLFTYILCNSCLVFLGSVVNLIVSSFGYSSVS